MRKLIVIIAIPLLLCDSSINEGPVNSTMTNEEELPVRVKKLLASRAMRLFHASWHFVRGGSPRNLPESVKGRMREVLSRCGYATHGPATRYSPGSGTDFLLMHWLMVELVEAELENDSGDVKLARWNVIPWGQDVVPDCFRLSNTSSTDNLEIIKSAQSASEKKKVVQSTFESDDWLKCASVDELGIRIEKDIHDWLHVRFADKESYAADIPPFNLDLENANLLNPWSAHVHDKFWQIHGWIDSRLMKWGEFHQSELDTLKIHYRNMHCPNNGGCKDLKAFVDSLEDRISGIEEQEIFKGLAPAVARDWFVMLEMENAYQQSETR